MQEHGLFALLVGFLFEESGTAALHLNPGAGFILNVLHILAALANDGRADVVLLNRLQTDDKTGLVLLGL